MSKSKAKKKIILLAFVLVVAGGGVYVACNALDWARIAAQNIASDALGVDVSVGSVDVSLADKSVRVSGVTIGNPRGYDTPYAVRLGAIKIAADILSRDQLAFRDVTVTDNTVFLEFKGVKSNLAALSNGIKTVPKKQTDSGHDKKSAGPNITIKTLLIDASSVTIRAPLLNTDTSLVVPPIRLTNVGQNNNQAAAVVAQITRAIISSVLNAAARNGVLGKITTTGTTLLDDGLKTGTDTLKKTLDRLKF
jgi:hypothetical protein